MRALAFYSPGYAKETIHSAPGGQVTVGSWKRSEGMPEPMLEPKTAVCSHSKQTVYMEIPSVQVKNICMLKPVSAKSISQMRNVRSPNAAGGDTNLALANLGRPCFHA